MSTMEKSLELASLDQEGRPLEPIPLVFVEGWAAGTSAKIFEGLDALLNENKPEGSPDRRLLVVNFSSLWDRAIEVYYALKGGRCDYGEAHAKEHGHARFGRTHATGLFPQWSTAHPLHFAGHSFGGCTLYHLQQMLGTSLPGSPEMLVSLAAISSPFRGTPLVSALGQQSGPLAGQRMLSLGYMLSLGVHLAKSANVVASELYDFGGDQWMQVDAEDEGSPQAEDDADSMEVADAAQASSNKVSVADAGLDAKPRPSLPRRQSQASVASTLMRSFLNFSNGKAEGLSRDSAGWCMLPDSMAHLNADTCLCEATFYRSYTASTDPPLLLPPLAVCHWLVAREKYTAEVQLQMQREGEEEAWRQSDCLVPLASQAHPFACSETTCLHLLPELLDDKQRQSALEPNLDEPPPVRGVWTVRHFADTSHFGLVDYLWKLGLSDKTQTFWRQHGAWLRTVDALRAEEQQAVDGETPRGVKRTRYEAGSFSTVRNEARLAKAMVAVLNGDVLESTEAMPSLSETSQAAAPASAKVMIADA